MSTVSVFIINDYCGMEHSHRPYLCLVGGLRPSSEVDAAVRVRRHGLGVLGRVPVLGAAAGGRGQ